MTKNKFFPEASATEIQQVKGRATVGGRRFLIDYSTGIESFHGEVTPEPVHKTVMVDHPGIGTLLSRSVLKFRIDRADESRQKGRFQGIEIVRGERGKGWASDMVRALLTFFPATYWNNEDLHEQSGPLFIKLQAEYPDRIAAVTDLGSGRFQIAHNPLMDK